MATRPSKEGRRRAALYDFFARSHIRLTDGDHHDRPFVLTDYQYRDIWEPIFGTLDPGGSRRFRKALIGQPRYSGKSNIAARMVLTVMMMEPAHRADYGIVASGKEQARIVFDMVCAMVRLDVELSARIDILRDSLVVRDTGAELKVYPAEVAAVQGRHFRACVIDEAHVWRNDSLYSAIVSGMKHPESLLVVITTASDARRGPLWDVIIPQMLADPEAYVHWCAAQSLEGQMAGEPFNPLDRRRWRRAAKAMRISTGEMDSQYRSLPLRDFMRYQLNIFPPDDAGEDSCFSPGKVGACLSDGAFDWDASLALGIDGAFRGDCLAMAFAHWDDGDVVLWPIIWEPDGVPYDLDQVEEMIVEYYSERDLDVYIDPARLTLMCKHLENRHGIRLESVAQNDKNMCARAANLHMLVNDGRLRVLGPDSGKWARHMMNAVWSDERAYGRRITKARGGRGKIDAAIASALAAFEVDSEEARDMSILTF